MTTRTLLFSVTGLAAAGAVAATLLNVPRLRAQAAPAPSFAVAPVKGNKGGDPGARIGRQPGDRFTLVNGPLRMLISLAYQLQGFQIEGGEPTGTDDLPRKHETTR